MMHTSIGHQVRLRRRALRITQVRLAELTGLDQPTVSRLENGSLIPPLPALERIAEALNLRLIINFEPMESAEQRPPEDRLSNHRNVSERRAGNEAARYAASNGAGDPVPRGRPAK